MLQLLLLLLLLLLWTHHWTHHWIEIGNPDVIFVTCVLLLASPLKPLHVAQVAHSF